MKYAVILEVDDKFLLNDAGELIRDDSIESICEEVNKRIFVNERIFASLSHISVRPLSEEIAC